jgi:hypothetical protein
MNRYNEPPDKWLAIFVGSPSEQKKPLPRYLSRNLFLARNVPNEVTAVKAGRGVAGLAVELLQVPSRRTPILSLTAIQMTRESLLHDPRNRDGAKSATHFANERVQFLLGDAFA